jgi:hypothetical protein
MRATVVALLVLVACGCGRPTPVGEFPRDDGEEAAALRRQAEIEAKSDAAVEQFLAFIKRREARSAIVEEDPDTVKGWAALLRAKDSWTRQRAARHLQHRGSGAESAIPDLRKAERGDPDADVRAAARYAISQIEKDLAVAAAVPKGTAADDAERRLKGLGFVCTRWSSKDEGQYLRGTRTRSAGWPVEEVTTALVSLERGKVVAVGVNSYLVGP